MLASQLLINKNQRRGPARSPGITLWVEVDVKRRLTGSSKVTTSINPIFQTQTQSKNPPHPQKRPINMFFFVKIGSKIIRRQLPPVSNLFWQQPVGGKKVFGEKCFGSSSNNGHPGLTPVTAYSRNWCQPQPQHGTEGIFHPNKAISCQCFPGNSRKEEMRAGRYPGWKSMNILQLNFLG